MTFLVQYVGTISHVLITKQTHRDNLGINECVQSPGSKPCIDKQPTVAAMDTGAITYSGMGYRTASSWSGGEQRKRVCQRI
jgi:hypothetical protein